MTELQILSAVKNNGGSIDYVTLLNIGLSDPEHDALTDRDLIHKLIDAQILSGKPGANSTISFGKEGRLRHRELLSQEDADRQAQQRTKEEQARLQRELSSKQAKEKSEKRRQRTFEIFLVFLSALVSNLDRIISWFASFF